MTYRENIKEVSTEKIVEDKTSLERVQ